MLLSMLSPIALGMMSEIPPNTNGNAVPGPGVGEQQLPVAPGANVVPGVPGAVDTNAPASEQSSPILANVPIEDTRFYVVDPARPEERVMGLQLREALHRGRQVDTLQSQLHQSQNQNTSLLARAEAAEAQVAVGQRQRDVVAALEGLGMTSQVGTQNLSGGNVPPAGQPPQVPGVQQTPAPGTVDPALAILQQGWRTDDGIPGAYGLTPGTGVDPSATPQGTLTPQGTTVPPVAPGPVGQTVPPAQNQIPLDPQALATQLLPILDHLVEQRMATVQGNLQNANQEGMQQLRQEALNRDNITSTVQNARAMRSETLTQQGVSQESITNILDLEDMSRVLERQAEGLIAGGQVELGRQKFAQAGQLQNQAITARTEAAMNHRQNQAYNTFQATIETDPYAALGVQAPDEGALPMDLKDPAAIQAAIQDNYNKAAQLVESRDRIERTAGVM